MLAAHMVVCAVKAALAVTEEAFDGVRRDVAARPIIVIAILFGRVIDASVGSEALARLVVERGLVGIQMGFVGNMALEQGFDYHAIDALDDSRADFAASFYNRNQRDLVAGIATAFAARLAAYVGFVSFNLANKLPTPPPAFTSLRAKRMRWQRKRAVRYEPISSWR